MRGITFWGTVYRAPDGVRLYRSLSVLCTERHRMCTELMRLSIRFIPSAAARNLAVVAALAHGLYGQTTVLNWEQIKARFLAQNPGVLASRISIEESKAA